MGLLNFDKWSRILVEIEVVVWFTYISWHFLQMEYNIMFFDLQFSLWLSVIPLIFLSGSRRGQVEQSGLEHLGVFGEMIIGFVGI